MDLHEIWPPFALTIRSGDIELSPVRESDYPELADIARGGVRRDGVQAFLVDWDTGDDVSIARSIAQYQWSTRANFTPDDWTVEFTVRASGRVVGVQGVSAKDYLKTRTVTTGSWLARQEQGQGIGTRMRAAVVRAFAEEFSAARFETAYFDGNEASRRVSEKLGYAPNGGHRVVAQDGRARTEHGMVLDAATRSEDEDEISVEGAEVFRRFIGLTEC